MKTTCFLKVTEKDTQKAILAYLSLKGLIHYRMNTGALVVDKRFLRFGSPGMADIVVFTKNSTIWIEVKGPKGVLSPGQKEFRDRHEKLGHLYVVARDLSDVSCLFEKGGKK